MNNNLFCTKRLVVKKIEKDDIPDYFELTRAPSIQRYVSYACPQTLEESYDDYEKYYAHQNFDYAFYLVMRHLDTNELVGSLIVTKNLEDEFEVAMFVSPQFEHQGYMYETLMGFVRFIPSNSHLVFFVETENKSSLNLVTRFPGITEDPKPGTYIRKFSLYC